MSFFGVSHRRVRGLMRFDILNAIPDGFLLLLWLSFIASEISVKELRQTPEFEPLVALSSKH
jgi:hypothetical protein